MEFCSEVAGTAMIFHVDATAPARACRIDTSLCQEEP